MMRPKIDITGKGVVFYTPGCRPGAGTGKQVTMLV